MSSFPLMLIQQIRFFHNGLLWILIETMWWWLGLPGEIHFDFAQNTIVPTMQNTHICFLTILIPLAMICTQDQWSRWWWIQWRWLAPKWECWCKINLHIWRLLQKGQTRGSVERSAGVRKHKTKHINPATVQQKVKLDGMWRYKTKN